MVAVSWRHRLILLGRVVLLCHRPDGGFEFTFDADKRRAVEMALELHPEKRDMARRIYHTTAEAERDDKKKQLARILSVSERTVRSWLSRIDKDAKEARNRRIFELWLSCHTQEEIAEIVGSDQRSLSFTEFGSIANLSKTQRVAAEHATGFEPPIYNIWKQQNKSGDVSHFGNSETTWLDNLLYLHTEPFDVVVDPFGGSGSTIDVCKKRFRRYLVSDRKPIVEREKEIRRNLSPDQKRGLVEKTRDAARRLREADPKRFTIEALAGMFGVSIGTIHNWSTTDFSSENGCTPDARVSILKSKEPP